MPQPEGAPPRSWQPRAVSARSLAASELPKGHTRQGTHPAERCPLAHPRWPAAHQRRTHAVLRAPPPWAAPA